MATQHQLTKPIEGISCHAWSPDRSQIAVCPNNNEIHIYDCTKTPWERKFVLTEHDLLVSALDWSAANNKIVSCSHDRNAFVWQFADDEWKPALVILRIDRAAIDVKWSLDGLRFAATSGAKCISVCTYEYQNNWWVSKIIKKKFKSTVLCCAFHPQNGQLLAAGSADFKCRVYSTFAADVDGTSVNAGPFGTPLEFGEPYVELTALGWVNAVAWSPSGDSLAFAGHDSSVHIATFSAAGPVVQIIRFRELPLNRLLFLSEAALAGVGHDFNPLIFSAKGGSWSFVRRLDQKKVEAAASGAQAGTGGGVAASRALFKNMSRMGQDKQADEDAIWTQHENLITGISVVSAIGPDTSKIRQIATSALDGRMVLWDLPSPSLALDMSALSIA